LWTAACLSVESRTRDEEKAQILWVSDLRKQGYSDGWNACSSTHEARAEAHHETRRHASQRFTPLPVPPAGLAEELFRRRVIRMLVRRGRVEEEAAEGLLAWRHSGFSEHHAIRVQPHDKEGVERLCRYLVHPPIAVERLRYDGTQATYSGRRMHPLSGQDSITLDPLEMLARLCQHIPPPGMHLTRLYGAYANRTRGTYAGRVARQAEKTAPGDGEPDTPKPSQGRRERARLVAKIFEVDPLRCTCGATMRVVAFILDPAVIRKILQHRPRTEPRAHAPPPG